MNLAQQEHGLLITQTPLRISFFGGGTDFPEYFNEETATVIGTAVNQYIYVTLNSLDRFFDKRIRLSYSKLETVDHPDELQHPIVKCILNKYRPSYHDSFLDIHTYADLPASTGTGSSSSFTVGMLNATYLLSGIYKSPEKLAKEAIFIEREELKDAGGWQDQIFAAYGGFNRIFFANNSFRVEPIRISASKRRALEQSCLLFFTGNVRSSAAVQKNVLDSNEQERKQHLKKIQLAALEGFEILNHATDEIELVHEFGKLLDQSWQAKRSMSSHISNPQIDEMYETALKAGALGGKLCGAGGGGFLLLVVPLEQQPKVSLALKNYKQLHLQFEDHGSRVLYSKVTHQHPQRTPRYEEVS